MITYWSCADALVQAYTLPYVRLMLRALPAGSVVHLVTLEKGTGPVTPHDLGPGIEHVPHRYHARGVGGAGMILSLTWLLVQRVRRMSIDTVHAWCTPAGMVGYLVSVITGRPLVIDSYEPHAEAMVENGTWRKGSLAFRVLFWFERLQTRRAQVLIAATEGMRNYALEKYGPTHARWFVKPACVDLERFCQMEVKRPDLLKAFGLEDKLVVVYAGKFGGIYLDREVFLLLRAARDRWGSALHALLLTPHTLEELLPWIEAVGLDPAMFTVRYVPHAGMPGMMGLADLAITPVKPVPTKRYCTPVKDGEYWALGLPVIITENISDDSGIIREQGIGSVWRSLDAKGCAEAVEGMARLLDGTTREERYERIRAVAVRYRSFDRAANIYSTIYGE